MDIELVGPINSQRLMQTAPEDKIANKEAFFCTRLFLEDIFVS